MPTTVPLTPTRPMALPRDPNPGWYTAVHDGGAWRRLMRPLRMEKSCGHDWNGCHPADLPLPVVGERTTCYSACDKVPFWRGRDADNPNLPRVTAVTAPEPPAGLVLPPLLED